MFLTTVLLFIPPGEVPHFKYFFRINRVPCALVPSFCQRSPVRCGNCGSFVVTIHVRYLSVPISPNFLSARTNFAFLVIRLFPFKFADGAVLLAGTPSQRPPRNDFVHLIRRLQPLAIFLSSLHINNIRGNFISHGIESS
jgi:hypothetical protein